MACGPSYADYCTELVDCVNARDSDVDACVASLEADSDRAGLYGCGDYYDEYQDCRAEQSTCEESGYTPADDCDEQARNYSACMSG